MSRDMSDTSPETYVVNPNTSSGIAVLRGFARKSSGFVRLSRRLDGAQRTPTNDSEADRCVRICDHLEDSNVSDLLRKVGLELRPLGRSPWDRKVLDVAGAGDQIRVARYFWICLTL